MLRKLANIRQTSPYLKNCGATLVISVKTFYNADILYFAGEGADLRNVLCYGWALV